MFSELFRTHIGRARGTATTLRPGVCMTRANTLCTLCHASRTAYDAEARSRGEALAKFWGGIPGAGPLAPLVRSPRGRHYRTVSKRKAFLVRDDVRLGLIEGEHGRRPLAVRECGIEPESHAALYAAVEASIHAPALRPLARALRYVIVRGTYEEIVVIFSVDRIDGQTVRSANALSRTITGSCPAVRGVLLYEDTGDDRYYLGGRGAPPRRSIRKIFGETDIRLTLGGRRFRCPPLSFSQVNASLVDALIAEAAAMLDLTAGADLYDLYCGYGLFTLTAGAAARGATGIERSAESIEAARRNAAAHGGSNARFLRADITESALGALLARLRSRDAVLLDPPRGGTAPGVIECVAAARPARVVHMFCNIDIMPGELERWNRGGYSVVRGVPFDMFPGTDETEIMVLLQRA
ncbi:MAG TPA: methyltransferase domain-containing protein [Bacteroidota bacterium]|nr:methyltransferase domain-containing protein [Bacteroidota bacterium]